MYGERLWKDITRNTFQVTRMTLSGYLRSSQWPPLVCPPAFDQQAGSVMPTLPLALLHFTIPLITWVINVPDSDLGRRSTGRNYLMIGTVGDKDRDSWWQGLPCHAVMEEVWVPPGALSARAREKKRLSRGVKAADLHARCLWRFPKVDGWPEPLLAVWRPPDTDAAPRQYAVLGKWTCCTWEWENEYKALICSVPVKSLDTYSFKIM